VADQKTRRSTGEAIARWLTRCGTVASSRRVRYRRHLFVCTNARTSGKPACGPGGGAALLAEVQRLLLGRGEAGREIGATGCACLGPCFDGPNAVVYPEGQWYAGLTAADAGPLVDALLDGPPLDARHYVWPDDA
jgi:(2Fe-2S) ferredoxin